MTTIFILWLMTANWAVPLGQYTTTEDCQTVKRALLQQSYKLPFFANPLSPGYASPLICIPSQIGKQGKEI